MQGRPVVVLIFAALSASVALADAGPVISVGEQIAVLWTDYTETGRLLMMQRFDRSGAHLNQAVTIARAPAIMNFRAASDGMNLIVLWSEFDWENRLGRVTAVLVDDDDQVRKLETVGSTTTEVETRPVFDVAWDGDEYLAAWSDGGKKPAQLVAADRSGGVINFVTLRGDWQFLSDIAIVPGFERHMVLVSAWRGDDGSWGKSVLFALSMNRSLQDRRLNEIDSIDSSLNAGCGGSRWMVALSGVFSGSRFEVAWSAVDCRRGDSERLADLAPDGTVLWKFHFTEIGNSYYTDRDSLRLFNTQDGVVALISGQEVLRRVSDAPPFFRRLPLAPGSNVAAVLPDGRGVVVTFTRNADGTQSVDARFVDAPVVPGRRLRRR